MAEIKRDSHWLVVVNPNAGGGKSNRLWPEIETSLTRQGLSFQSRFTAGRFHAAEIARESIERGYRKFIVVGGDGTLNELINGIFTIEENAADQIVVAMIPVGTGNDWGRQYNIPTDYRGAIEAIKAGKTMTQDLGCVDFGITSGKRFFINVAGIGYDAEVVKRTNLGKEKGSLGRFSYMLTLLRSILGYRFVESLMEVEGKRTLVRLFSASIAIGKYSGGGMQQAPDAIPDDGMFDITVIGQLPKAKMIWNLRKLYDGSIYQIKGISCLRTAQVKFETNPPVFCETDGENAGKLPATFTIVPAGIRIVHNLLQ